MRNTSIFLFTKGTCLSCVNLNRRGNECVRHLQVHVSRLLSHVSEHIPTQSGLVSAWACHSWDSPWPAFQLKHNLIKHLILYLGGLYQWPAEYWSSWSDTISQWKNTFHSEKKTIIRGKIQRKLFWQFIGNPRVIILFLELQMFLKQKVELPYSGILSFHLRWTDSYWHENCFATSFACLTIELKNLNKRYLINIVKKYSNR
jgi:hypothetical protein